MNQHSLRQFKSARRPAADAPMVFCYIMDVLTNRCIGSAGFTDFITHRWPWVQHTVAGQYDCSPDDVHCIETDDGDRITARGEVVAYLAD